MLAANSPQEAQDFALIAQARRLGRTHSGDPFFSTASALARGGEDRAVEADIVRAMLDADLSRRTVHARWSPEHPVLRAPRRTPTCLPVARTPNPFYDAFRRSCRTR